jgi:hypothetical protein
MMNEVQINKLWYIDLVVKCPTHIKCIILKKVCF